MVKEKQLSPYILNILEIPNARFCYRYAVIVSSLIFDLHFRYSWKKMEVRRWQVTGLMLDGPLGIMRGHAGPGIGASEIFNIEVALQVTCHLPWNVEDDSRSPVSFAICHAEDYVLMSKVSNCHHELNSVTVGGLPHWVRYPDPRYTCFCSS